MLQAHMSARPPTTVNMPEFNNSTKPITTQAAAASCHAPQ
jgi:hypothetical protein